MHAFDNAIIIFKLTMYTYCMGGEATLETSIIHI